MILLPIWMSKADDGCFSSMQLALPTCTAWAALIASLLPTSPFAPLHRAKETRGRYETHMTHEHLRGEYTTMLDWLTAAAVTVVAGQMGAGVSENAVACDSFASCGCAQGEERPRVPRSAVLPIGCSLILWCAFLCCRPILSNPCTGAMPEPGLQQSSAAQPRGSVHPHVS